MENTNMPYIGLIIREIGFETLSQNTSSTDFSSFQCYSIAPSIVESEYNQTGCMVF